MKTDRLLLLIAVALSAVALVVSLFGNAATYKIARDSGEDSATVFAALCNFKADLRTRRNNAIHFLALTPEQRTKAFGPAFANIPNATIEQQISNQNSTLAALTALDC